MRDKTLETLILYCIAHYDMDEPEDVLMAEVYLRRTDVSTQRFNETMKHLVERGLVARNTTKIGDTTFALTVDGQHALEGI